MKNIYILGSLNTDLAIYLERFPRPGETLRGSSFRIGSGGKGLNQAIAAAKLGGKVHFLGAVGKDVFGKTMKAELRKAGVNVAHVKEKDDVASGVALIEVSKDENAIALDLGANERIEKSDIDSFLEKAEAGDVFLSQGENNFEALEYALPLAKAKKMITVLNPAPADKKMLALLDKVDVLLPNEKEAALLSGSADVRKGATLLKAKTVVITLGKDGYFAKDGDDLYSEPAVEVDVIDTTGAGDAFCGSFAFFLSEEVALKNSLRLASLYASLETTKKGTSAAMADPKNFKTFVKKEKPDLLYLLR